MDDIEELENKLKTSKDNIHLYNKKNKPDKKLADVLMFI